MAEQRRLNAKQLRRFPPRRRGALAAGGARARLQAECAPAERAGRGRRAGRARPSLGNARPVPALPERGRHAAGGRAQPPKLRLRRRAQLETPRRLPAEPAGETRAPGAQCAPPGTGDQSLRRRKETETERRLCGSLPGSNESARRDLKAWKRLLFGFWKQAPRAAHTTGLLPRGPTPSSAEAGRGHDGLRPRVGGVGGEASARGRSGLRAAGGLSHARGLSGPAEEAALPTRCLAKRAPVGDPGEGKPVRPLTGCTPEHSASQRRPRPPADREGGKEGGFTSPCSAGAREGAAAAGAARPAHPAESARARRGSAPSHPSDGDPGDIWVEGPHGILCCSSCFYPPPPSLSLHSSRQQALCLKASGEAYP